jgi:hypothetical protein
MESLPGQLGIPLLTLIPMLSLLLSLASALVDLLDLISLLDAIHSSAVGVRWLGSPSYREELRRNKNHKDLPRLDACAGMLVVGFVILFSLGTFFITKHFAG